LMGRYYELLLGRIVPADMHPLEAKKQLAFEIVRTYQSADAGKKVLEEWNTRFSKRDLEHADLPAFAPTERGELVAVDLVTCVYRNVFALTRSHSEVSRLIKQGSIEIDGTKIRDPKAKISLRPGQILRLDRKHAVRID
jgi:tyrosyl-tRNA synthetase